MASLIKPLLAFSLKINGTHSEPELNFLESETLIARIVLVVRPNAGAMSPTS
jgi:hypothetical protein